MTKKKKTKSIVKSKASSPKAKAPCANKFSLDTDSVRVLASILRETGLNEIEYVEGEKKIRVASGGTIGSAPLSSYVQVAAPAGVTTADVGTTAQSAPTNKEPSKGSPILSPMVGTVYLSSEPKAKPFVKIGDRVKQGDTLLIIEAMKVMNPIKAPQAGEIVEILISDSKPVEFGEPLMIIA